MRFKLTEEQQLFYDTALSGESFVTDAVAGSGKTSTAQRAIENMGGRILYLAFNRSAKDEAQRRMSHLPYVTVKTTAGLAWSAYHRYYSKRMDRDTPLVPASTTAKIARIKDGLSLGDTHFSPVQIACFAQEAIDNYCRSSRTDISEEDVPVIPGLPEEYTKEFQETVVHWAQNIWNQSIIPTSKHRFSVWYALKLLSLSEDNPYLEYDSIVLDEAQDSNPCVERLVKNQMGQKIIIGDPAQSLYEWNGAVNIMPRFSGPRLSLTQSWRFGKAIEEVANLWLKYTGTGLHVRGNPKRSDHVTTRGLINPDLVLCRTNAAALSESIRFLDQGKKVAMVGGADKLKSFAFSAGDLMAGRPVTNPQLAAFETWGDLVAFAEEPGGGDLRAAVQLIQTRGLKQVITACKRLTSETRSPDVTVSTSHKAKGQEATSVQIGPDFKAPEPVVDLESGEERQGEITHVDAMLYYVTVTRAKDVLDLGSLDWAPEGDPVSTLSK